MKAQRTLICVLVGLVGLAAAHAQDDISISISKHAGLAADGAVIVRIHIACDPLPGIEEFQEGFAGARQARTGAEAESGIDGTIVCDGVAHTHTARLFPLDAGFRRGPARADASVFICNVVSEEQICISGAAERRIVIRGRLVP